MNNGIQPTVELATNNGNGYYPYPVYPMMGGNGYGNSGFFGSDGIWAILLFALIFGNGWGNNGNGGFFGGNSFDNGYAWLSNGQKEIMQNTNTGFDTLHLSNQIEGVRDGVWGLSNQLCNCCSDINSNISNGFANAEVSNNARQIANMQQAFASQTAITGGLTNLSNQFADCCCENRLANCQTQNIIQNEGNSTRFANANNTRDIIDSQTRGTQAILDKLCQLELDGVKAQVEAKNDRIAELTTQLNMATLRESQTAQTAQIRIAEENQFENFYNRLKNCPVNAVAVYGNTPVFACPNNNGCGCNGNNAFLY